MNSTVVTYVIYLLVSIGITIWVGRTLSRAGKAFLADVFRDSALADAVNHLLVVGFYLVNLGFVALWLRGGENDVQSTVGVFRALSVKLGTVLLVLGLLHLINVYVLNRFRRGGVSGPQGPSRRPAAAPFWAAPDLAVPGAPGTPGAPGVPTGPQG